MDAIESPLLAATAAGHEQRELFRRAESAPPARVITISAAVENAPARFPKAARACRTAAVPYVARRVAIRKASAAIHRREFVPRDSRSFRGNQHRWCLPRWKRSNRPYSRRQRQGTSSANFPGVRNRPARVGVPAPPLTRSHDSGRPHSRRRFRRDDLLSWRLVPLSLGVS